MTSKVKYLDNLRTRCIHLKSNAEILTDAPTDNNGKGEAFSPTDTVATALASCMLTVMGIKAKELNVSIKDSKAEVQKVMASNPRRISKIMINIKMNESTNEKNKRILENVANSCPVLHSLHPDIEKKINFQW